MGDTTARVIAEAVAGETPTYLLHLEEEAEPALTGPAAQLRNLLRGDCHSHSDWSDGGSPIAEMADAAAALGHEYLALTDHSPAAHRRPRSRPRATACASSRWSRR